MKQKLPWVHIVTFLLGIACFASLFSAGFKGCGQASPSSPPFPSLTFTMVPVKPSVLLLEPIALRFGLANNADEELPMKGFMALHTLKLLIRKPNGEFIESDELKLTTGSAIFQDQSSKAESGSSKTWIDHLEFNLEE